MRISFNMDSYSDRLYNKYIQNVAIKGLIEDITNMILR